MTPEEQQEYDRTLGSRLWRLNNLYTFIDRYGKKAIFSINHVQKELLKNLWYLNVILKSRQQGITTFMCILFLDIALFSENVHCGIVAHKLQDAKGFFDDKIRFAYNNLPEEIKARVPLVKDTDMRLIFANGSKITVGTGLRGGTYQYLHISEHGKICAAYPKKALEVKTGALNTVAPGQYIFIESTAEGRSGDFYDFCETAQKNLLLGKKLTVMDWRFHFFGWTNDPTCRLDPEGVMIPQEVHEYFAELEAKQGIKVDAWQKAWFTLKRAQQGVDGMYREYPAYPEEAFFAAIKGAYYKEQMLKLRQQYPPRFATVPYEPRLKVDTGWDLGMRDTTCIVFRQKVGNENRIIDYIENSGEELAWYVAELQRRPYVYGAHYLPHDVAVRSLNDGVSREAKLTQLGLRNVITVERTRNIEDGIEETRNFLMSCWFDGVKTARLVDALDEYRKKWNETTGAFSSQPLHNWASNPADAFRTLACGVSSNETGSEDFLDRGRSNWRTA